MDNEDLLIKQVFSGDMNSFKALVEKYQGFVYAICLSIIRDPHEAENIAQETFLKVYRSLHLYSYKGFKTWIGKIATNLSIDFKRRNSSSKLALVSYLEEVNNQDCINQISMQDELIAREDKKRILRLCSKLPDIYKSVVNKYYIQEMSYQSIAHEEGISIKTVESRLYRAKKLLREGWEVDSNETL